VGFPQHPQPHPAMAPAHREPVMQAAPAPASSGQGAGYIPQPPPKPLLSAAYHGATEHAEFDLPEPVLKTEQRANPTSPTPAGQRPVMPEPARPQEAPKRGSLFSRVFGGAPSPATAPVARAHQEPVISASHRQQPAMADLHTQPEPSRAAVRPAQIDEIGLEIPAFLRRSSN
jgi:cell division protein FtsZ